MWDNLAGEYLQIQFQWLENIWIMSQPTGIWQEVDQFGQESARYKNRVKSSNWMASWTTGSWWGMDLVVSKTDSRYKPSESV